MSPKRPVTVPVKPPVAEPESKRIRVQYPVPVGSDDTANSAATPVLIESVTPSPVPRVPLPRIPSDDPVNSVATPARNVLSGIVPWVLENLREYMKMHRGLFDDVADLPLHEHQPLHIEEKQKNSASLKSYKALWDKGAASDALATTDMYEAAGNIVWARLFPVSQEMEIVAGAPVAFEQVVELADNFFASDAFVATQGNGVGEGEEKVAIPRIVLFPITMYVNASADLNIATASHFNACPVMRSRHELK